MYEEDDNLPVSYSLMQIVEWLQDHDITFCYHSPNPQLDLRIQDDTYLFCETGLCIFLFIDPPSSADGNTISRQALKISVQTHPKLALASFAATVVSTHNQVIIDSLEKRGSSMLHEVWRHPTPIHLFDYIGRLQDLVASFIPETKESVPAPLPPSNQAEIDVDLQHRRQMVEED